MKSIEYRVSEIFNSIQGEGAKVGTPMTFIRFAGCNLRCSFCDTSHPVRAMENAEGLIKLVKGMQGFGPAWACLTGGEPMLQINAYLIHCLLTNGWDGVAIETNGTFNTCPLVYETRTYGWGEHRLWITVSPKEGGTWISKTYVNEVKLVVEDESNDGWLMERMLETEELDHVQRFLQPCFYAESTERTNRARQKAIDLVMEFAHRGWRLSFQAHRFLGLQ